MYRNDQDAMAARLDALERQVGNEDKLRQELVDLRRAASRVPGGNPYLNFAAVGDAEKEALSRHSLEEFPVWAIPFLHIITFGLFSLIWFGLQHDRMPNAAHDDPSAGKAIGFQFIPYFNLYWMFFSPMRLCDRVTFQYRLRGLSEEAPKGMFLASAVTTVVPYIGTIPALFILWPIANCLLQSKINRLKEYDRQRGTGSALPPVQPHPQLTA